jgi:cyclase
VTGSRSSVSLLLRTALLAVGIVSVPPAVLAHMGPPPGPSGATTGKAEATPAPPPQAPAFQLEKLTDRAYCLYGKGGNVGFLVTDGGVVVVDDQFRDVAPGIVEQIRKVTGKPIRYLINTHYHPDHTGGNPVFEPLAPIVAQQEVRRRMVEFIPSLRTILPARIEGLQGEIAVVKDPADPYRVALEKDVDLMKFLLDTTMSYDPAAAAPPSVTYEHGLSLWVGGQRIDIVHVAPGHTDGDSIVFFPGENVVHAGDLFVNGLVPFIDTLGGGSARGFVENLDYLLAHLPQDARVIPGHGKVAGVVEVRRLRGFLAELDDLAAKAAAAGVSRAEAVRSITLPKYSDLKQGFRTVGNAVAAAYDEAAAARK